ncbi:heparin lyase I family protein [Aquimarina aggregata]|uniref:heparin lyase I family protein n=1 Tax=Aquimarina aggregata TaxID=1642818 RepID=UPI002491E173|nr:heparin lyase I family protein [Aquimarina aggregata]
MKTSQLTLFITLFLIFQINGQEVPEPERNAALSPPIIAPYGLLIDGLPFDGRHFFWRPETQGGHTMHPLDPNNNWDMEVWNNNGYNSDGVVRVSTVHSPIRTHDNNKSIRIQVKDENDNAGGIDDGRSRAEVKVFPQHGDGDEFFYAWSFLIPDTDEHPDDIISDNIIAQWHEKNEIVWENNRKVQPPFFLTFKNDKNRNQNDKKRNLHIMYGFRYSENGNQGDFKSFTLTDAIEKGSWQDVIMHIKWSTDPSIAFMEMWINDSKVIDPNTGEDIFYKANLYRDSESLSPQPNYFKLGQYRLGQTIAQSIYIDEFRIGNTKEEVNMRTSLIADDCGRILTYDNMTISCNEVIGARGYHFYFPNEDKIIYSKRPSIDLAFLDWIDLNTTYDIQCRVALYDESNRTDLFGSVCKVTTPAPFKTKLTHEYCSVALESENLNIKAYPVPGATQYKFYVSGVTNPIEKNEPFLNLDDYDWFNFNSSYQISVRVSKPENAGLINHAGQKCTIYSPMKTKLKDEYCENTLTSINPSVRAYTVSGATQYKFYVSGVSNPIERNDPFLNLNDYHWFNFNTNYQISVRVSKPENTGFINHTGEVCSVKFINSSNRQADENRSLKNNNLTESLSIYPNPSNGVISINGYNEREIKVDLFSINGSKIPFEIQHKGSDILIKTKYKGLVFLYLQEKNNIKTYKVWIK